MRISLPYSGWFAAAAAVWRRSVYGATLMVEGLPPTGRDFALRRGFTRQELCVSGPSVFFQARS